MNSEQDGRQKPGDDGTHGDGQQDDDDGAEHHVGGNLLFFLFGIHSHFPPSQSDRVTLNCTADRTAIMMARITPIALP